GIPTFIMDGLQLIARTALGMGLISIGAGLRLGDLFKPSIAVYIPTLLKLVVFPIIVVTVAILIGVRGAELSYLALCASVPTAMNGYVLARQMGGDADVYAITVTVQTVVAFFSIPAVLAIVDQLIGG
ncbi:MAG: AEC family transporter, partial [Pseudomonadota bacterium]